jgi:pyridinium-3,5-bisthiocarboxylic acid mononucleotide nickel chelatase
MAIAHFDPFAGIAGDMIVGALIDAGASFDIVREAVLSTGIKGIELSVEEVSRKGLRATHFRVDAGHQHHHRSLSDILLIIDAADISSLTAERASAVFKRLAEAEAQAHGCELEKVHFHEVGAIDAIVDVLASCVALESLGVEQVSSGPPALGHDGLVSCAHGDIPVPVPAVCNLLKGRSTKPGLSGIEMTTPTGAAVISSLCPQFCAMPAMKLLAVGCGAGTRQDPRIPNLLRVFIGQAQESLSSSDSLEQGDNAELLEISAVIDDLSPEVLGYLFESLPPAGAIEVSLLPLTLKKSRPGHRLTVLAPALKLQEVSAAIFSQTSTFGLRYHPVCRITLERKFVSVATTHGPVRIKCGYLDGKLLSASPEFEDCRSLAREAGIPLKELQAEALLIFSKQQSS